MIGTAVPAVAPYYGLLVVSGALLVLGARMRAPVHSGGFESFESRRTPRLVLPSPFALLLFAVLALFSGLRFDVGSDYEMYYRTFMTEVDPTSLGGTLAASRFEGGFAALEFMLRQFSSSPQALFVVCAVATVGIVYVSYSRMLGRLEGAIFYWLLFGYYLGSMNLVRQSLAAALALLGMALWTKNRSASVALWVLAVLFHASALAFVLGFLLARTARFRWGAVLWLLLLSVVANPILSTAPGVRGVVSLVNDDYVQYLGQSGAGAGLVLGAILRVSIILLCYLVLRGKVVDHNLGVAIYMTAIGACAWILSVGTLWIFRLDDYFGLFLPILLVTTGRSIDSASRRRWFYSVVGLAGIGYFALYVAYFSGLLPYASVVGELETLIGSLT